MKTLVLSVATYASPCGDLLLGVMEDNVVCCDWIGSKCDHRIYRHLKRHLNWSEEIVEGNFLPDDKLLLDEAVCQLDAYFEGRLHQFDLPLHIVGTAMQKQVWHALSEIPYGQTISYSALAARIGHPRAVRAVSNAVGANLINIIIPCHRVVGSKGGLTGYAGGLAAKAYLLRHEELNK